MNSFAAEQFHSDTRLEAMDRRALNNLKKLVVDDVRRYAGEYCPSECVIEQRSSQHSQLWFGVDGPISYELRWLNAQIAGRTKYKVVIGTVRGSNNCCRKKSHLTDKHVGRKESSELPSLVSLPIVMATNSVLLQSVQ
ncbi:hypothetical protein TNCV_3365521 [Trichonephila clavipes]|nr:hypothetical protein TNCV_3365521 [Trichonephila clavipes]